MRRKHIPPVVRGFVTRVCTVFGQFCTEGITFNGRSRPSDRVRGQSSRPWDNKGAGLKKHFISTLWASVWSKNRGGPGPLPLICHVLKVPLHTQLWVMNKISNNFHQRAVTIIYFLVIFAGIALKLHGCHYGPLGGGGGWGGDFPWLPWWWPPAIFIGNKMKMRPKELCGCSVPHLHTVLIANMHKLAIIGNIWQETISVPKFSLNNRTLNNIHVAVIISLIRKEGWSSDKDNDE